jgi:hypothetical protein
MSQRERPGISFLSPAYRTEQFLAETIDSVVAQTCGDWELVVVDNGNSDEVAAIVSGYVHDERIRLVRQENKGYTGGVMAAAAVARGAYLSVLDSDDQLTPDFVGTMLSYLLAHPEVDAIGCDAHLFYDGEQGTYGRGYLHSNGLRPPTATGERLTVEEVLGGRVPYYTAAVRREAWDAVGGYEPGAVGVDESVLIWLLLATRFEVRLIPHRLARYRVRAESLSRDPEKIERFEAQLIATFETFAQGSGKPEHLAAAAAPVRRLRYHQALRRARAAFIHNDTRTARQFAREAFGLRHTARATAVIVALALPPRLLLAVYRKKQDVVTRGRQLRQRLPL